MIDAIDVGMRIASVRCEDKTCPYYGNIWFFTLDEDNNVVDHTHTPYQGTATDE